MPIVNTYWSPVSCTLFHFFVNCFLRLIGWATILLELAQSPVTAVRMRTPERVRARTLRVFLLLLQRVVVGLNKRYYFAYNTKSVCDTFSICAYMNSEECQLLISIKSQARHQLDTMTQLKNLWVVVVILLGVLSGMLLIPGTVEKHHLIILILILLLYYNLDNMYKDS